MSECKVMALIAVLYP